MIKTQLELSQELAAIGHQIAIDRYAPLDRHRDFAAVFDGDRGRRVLLQILLMAKVFDRTYVLGDTHESARLEGGRNIGLTIMEILDPGSVETPPDTTTTVNPTGATGDSHEN